jgi:phospholipid transport system substrate-binding protein
MEHTVKNALLALAAGLLMSAAALAAPTAKDAEELITNSANEINVIVEGASAYYDTDRERYHKEIAAVLDPVVDFTTFAKGVMGNRASERYVQSLPESEREAARATVPHFRDVLYHTVIKSYGKIFYNYKGSKFSIKSSELLGKGDRASVTQQVIDPQGEHYVLQYTLNAQGDQGWKIQNVIVDGVNMGQSYRAQFEAAVDRYKGDVNEVIKNWPQIMDGHE